MLSRTPVASTRSNEARRFWTPSHRGFFVGEDVEDRAAHELVPLVVDPVIASVDGWLATDRTGLG